MGLEQLSASSGRRGQPRPSTARDQGAEQQQQQQQEKKKSYAQKLVLVKTFTFYF